MSMWIRNLRDKGQIATNNNVEDVVIEDVIEDVEDDSLELEEEQAEMGRPIKYNAFPQTGWPSVCEVHWSTSGGLVLGAGLDATTGKPGAGKHIHLIGMIAVDPAEVRQNTSGGSIVLKLPAEADGLRFPGAVDMGDDNALYVATSDDVTVFYYIHDANINQI